MNRPSIVVSSREIVDTVYRASKMVGSASGEASMLGRSTCFALGQLGRSLTPLLDAVEDGRRPAFGFPVVAAVEAAAKRDGGAVGAARRLSVADLAHPAYSATLRGTVVRMEVGGRLLEPAQWLDPSLAETEVTVLDAIGSTVDPVLRSRVESRFAEILSAGLVVDEDEWNRLVACGAKYLVRESVIDAVDQPTD